MTDDKPKARKDSKTSKAPKDTETSKDPGTLKDKVAAGQARYEQRTENTTTMLDRAGEAVIEAKDKFTTFAKEHPLTTIAGGVAIGILISGLFKRSPTRRVANKAAGKAAGLAAIGAELAMAYAQQAMSAASDVGKAGADKLEGFGGNARSLGRDAAVRAGDLGDSARSVARGTSRRIASAIRSRTS
jgi:ElaB/YqjD/DUF883 family membrane-anchored ribosome-binding protein